MKPIEYSDNLRIRKLTELTNPETFWDDVRKLTKRCRSDHAIGRWQCLAEQRYEELTAKNNFPASVSES